MISFTADAIHCQKELTHLIRSKQADYVLVLKGNQGTLYEEAALYRHSVATKINHKPYHYQTIEKDHGRLETRNYGQLMN